MATEVTRPSTSSGQPSSGGMNKLETPYLSPQTLLSGLQQVFQRLHGTRLASFPLGGEEKGAVESFAGLEKEILGLHDRAQALDLDHQHLLDKIKDIEGKNKQLVEKNKCFLEKNVQLTAQNRCLKDGSHSLQQENRKLQEEAEECRRRQCDLARELQRVRAQCLELETQTQEVDSLRVQVADQTVTIATLRQACTDKDRRIELIQHRKKRRRLIRSQEKIQGVKETFYGYDDDENDASIDSENSLSSVSVSTISEEDGCDELSREELERSHRQMLKEHLQLERSHALLQAHTGSSQDPYRELQTRSQLQADLFSALCRVELLEKEIRTLQAKQQRATRASAAAGEAGADYPDVLVLLRERDDLLTARRGLQMRLEQADSEITRLRQELRKSEERAEDLEFRILELEENPSCQGHRHDFDPHHGDKPDLEGRDLDLCEADQADVAECITKTIATSTVVERLPGQGPSTSSSADQLSVPGIVADSYISKMEFQRLKDELKSALQRHGVKAEAVLKDLGVLKEMEQKVSSLERMGMEMQKKVIILQQEKDRLEQRLMRGAPLSLTTEVERRQNLELKEEISHLTSAKEECSAENSRLAKQLEESEHLCISLQEQLKEFLEPSGSIDICGLGSGLQNRKDIERVAEDAGSKRIIPCSKNIQTDKPVDTKRRDNKSRSRSRDSERAEIHALTQKVKTLQGQVKKLEAENLELVEKLARSSNDSSSDDDDPNQMSMKQKPKQKVKVLERELQLLHSENIRLVDRLGGYSSGTPLDPEEVVEKIVELEDHCSNLQDRMREVEGQERQTRDKLRLAEQTINELELSETQYRDRCDELSQLEKETKKQLHTLQTTGRELREIILDKEVLEQALKEKVEFLEKVEAQSTQRITELESVEKSLREQLELQNTAVTGSDPLYHTFKEKLAAAEHEVRTLKEKNCELEETEEILRENWRRVADEDASRLRCLEEKVRMLEIINLDLKTKVAEAQDFVVINSGPAKGSLADELSASAAGRRVQSRQHSESPVFMGSEGEESGEESPQKKVTKLKRQLSLLEEEKNSKIAALQERLANLKENEIKLSETLAEMEMTERELRAKLALYESSEVTVEKMLKYQDKIDELRTSQESLLDQLETMETHEVTLQEKLEETERRFKGKIVSLEVEMKNLKQKELKGNARIRELEKHEEDLIEKTKTQAEKENGLYVRISGLMDQVKELMVKVTEQDKKIAEKDERCRKVASLEAKFLQIEGAYREKVTSLESSLSGAQSQLEEEVQQHADTQRKLDTVLQTREQEHSQRVFILQEMFAQKEKALNNKVATVESALSERENAAAEKEKMLIDKIESLEKTLSETKTAAADFAQKENVLCGKIASLENILTERDSAISEHAQKKKVLSDKISSLESSLNERESAIAKHDKVLHDRDNRIAQCEAELGGQKSKIRELEEVISNLQCKENDLEKIMQLKDMRIVESEKDLVNKADRISCLEKYVSEKESCVSKLENEISDLREDAKAKGQTIVDLERELSEKVMCVSELEREMDRKDERIAEAEKAVAESKTMKSRLAEMEGVISELKHKLSEKDSHISGLEQEVSRSELQIGHVRKDVNEKDEQISNLKTELSERWLRISELEKDVSRKEEQVNKMLSDFSEKEAYIGSLEKELSQKESQVRHLESVLEDREGQIGQLEVQLDSKDRESSSRLESARQDMISKDIHIANMEERVIQVTAAMSEVEKTMAEKNACISSLKDQLADRDSITSQQVSQLHSKLESEQKSSTSKLSSLEEELTATKVQLSQSDIKSGDCSKKLALVEKELEEERASVQSLKLEMLTLVAERERLQGELTTRVSDLESQLREQDSDFETWMSVREGEFKKTCSSLESECESQRNELMEKGKVIERLESTKNDLLSRLENIKDRERQLVSRFSEVDLELTTLRLQKDCEMKEAALMWEKQLEDTEREKQSAVEKALNLEANLCTSSQTIQQQLEKMSQLQSELNKARSEVVTLQGTLSQLQHQEEESQIQREQLVQQETMLKTRVSQAEAQLQDRQAQSINTAQLLAQKDSLEQALLKARAELTDSLASNVQLRETVSELKRHTQSLQEEVAGLQRLVSELQVSQEKEQEVQKTLIQKQEYLLKLESEVGHLKDDKNSALAKAADLEQELQLCRDTIRKLEADVENLGQAELTLKSQISAEQSTRSETDRRLHQAAEEVTSYQERAAQLLKETSEKNIEIEQLKTEISLLKQELQTQQGLRQNAEQNDQELHRLKSSEEALEKREAVLQERVTSMVAQMSRHQEDHSLMCQKLQQLEQREKELLEQITDVEHNVIEPLEAENAELKEEVSALRQQIESFNLQMDKQEEQAREDSAELDTLRSTVNDMQVSRTEALSKLDNVKLELRHLQSDNEVLQHRVSDLECLNQTMTDQLKNSKAELHKLERGCSKDVNSQEAQTESRAWVSENEWQNLQQKLTLLQDAEGKFMSRIIDLEEHEEKLSEELESTKRHLKEKDQQLLQQQTLLHQSEPYTSDACVKTEDPQEGSSTKVSELLARMQELESANQNLSSSLEQATARELDRKQLLDRLHVLEVAEERLMDRVIQLEEAEVVLTTQLDRSRHRAKVADQLEEEVSILLQQEDDWKDKVTALTSETADLSEKVDSLQRELSQEQSRAGHLQIKLDTVRSEYEEKLSALEESERRLERQLDGNSQGEWQLRQELQVLKEEMEDVCERYKDLEQENSRLRQQHTQLTKELQQAHDRCQQLAGGVTREPSVQAAQAFSLQSAVPSAGQSRQSGLPSSVRVTASSASHTAAAPSSLSTSSPDSQYSPQPPQVCSRVTLHMVPSHEGASHSSQTSHTHTTQLKLEPRSPDKPCDSDSNNIHSASVHSVRVLTMHDVLEENASLKAQLQELKSHSVSQDVSQSQHASPIRSVDASQSPVESSGRGVSQSSETLRLQSEIWRLESRVLELEKSLQAAEGAVQEVVTVIRTRSVHTLEQKIETIQRTIHTQSPAWSLHQELLELLTTQADLQKQVSHLMETEHNLRVTLKQVEDELARVKSEEGAATVGGRRYDSDRRNSLQSRLARFGGGISSTKAYSETSRGQVDISKKTKEQWLERQVADLQLAKTNLERRLHETERRLAFRPRPTSASRDELLFRIEQLEEEQGGWRKKVEDLEALNSHYLKEKLELASERDSLELRLQTQSPSTSKELNLPFAGTQREEPLGSSGSASEAEQGGSSVEHPESDNTMRDRLEDVLQKRIKELENLESYLRQQLNEVESDREQLHEIARKDKATIHEQNVRLRELMLLERNLRSQVSGLEDSERSLYNRSSELEDNVSRLEDRVHELEVHERRLRELVRKLKLDEEVWLSKSGDLTTSMEQLTSSEVSLRKMVQDLQLEKSGLVDRVEYLEVRVRELESLETTLVQRLKNYENVEASLQSRLHHTESSEAAAHSKASELDVINMDLSSRLQRAVEENAVLSQHVAQQQGQIHEMDRQLSAASDAQVSLSQHVDSLQKNEAVLQKKVREYELRDIDAQARVRELEQTEEILKDKINQLQRNENRLKSRLAELETASSQVLENLSPAQRQQLPQQLEDCQRRVVVLQRQLEAAQAELHRLPPPLTHSADQESIDGAATTVMVPTAAYVEMRSKVALLQESEYQVGELEKLNSQLSQTILQLRQGKGSCGHEVELEVLKRRLHSYKNTVQELKHHLSEGQVPSLRAADSGQGPESEDLPARNLQGLESERVLHSVRSLTQPPGATHTQHIVQAHSSPLQARQRAPGAATTTGASDLPVEEIEEESRWRQVEQRRNLQGGEGEQRGATPSTHTHASHFTHAASSSLQEELMMGVSLPSESERGSVGPWQNDTDSEQSGISRPHLRVIGSTAHPGSTPSVPYPGVVPAPRGGGRGEAQTPPMPMVTKKPPTTSAPPLTRQQRTNSGFVTDDSFYLPSSAPASEPESQEESEAPPLPSSAPPGTQMSARPTSHPQALPSSSSPRTAKMAVTVTKKGEEGVKGGEVAGGQKGRIQTAPLQLASLETSSVLGLSIRQRIAQIERQLQDNPSQKAGSKAEDEVFTWKAKATENARLLGAAEREGKQLKEDINKLEKDLEEKRRYIYIFEKWIFDAEEVLKNKNKRNDRDLVQQLQTEVKHLKQDLGNAGYRKADIFTDPAALRTELDHRDRELLAKRSEVESLTREVEQWRGEAASVEAMRKNALDALRQLETEVSVLQEADTQLKQMKDEYNTLRGQFEEVWKKYQDLNKTLSNKDELEFTLKRTILERDHLKCDLSKVIEERDDLEPKLHELRTRVRELSNVKAENSLLESQMANLNKSLRERTDKLREVYEENLNLHERLADLQQRLDRLREARRDLDNLCARYDEVSIQKNKAVTAVHTLRAKVTRLARKCQEKDELLRHLSEEVRVGQGRSSTVLDELTRLETMAGGEEYNRPLSPLDLITGPTNSDTERLLSERIPQATTLTHWSSLTSLSDPHDLSGAGAEPLHSRDKTSLYRPRSAEQTRRHSTGTGGGFGMGGNSLCVSIMDYTPDAASRSGHRHLELPLKEGVQVRVLGPVDRHGYCEAEVEGRKGLVPASHLYPITDSAATYRTTSKKHGPHKNGGGDNSAQQIVQMFEELKDPRLMSSLPVTAGQSAQQKTPLTIRHSTTTATQTRQRLSLSKTSAGPEAPSGLHIKEVDGSSVVLAWQPPILDQHGCSNGCKVVGFRIYLNGRVCQQPHNPRLSCTRIEGVRSDRPQQLAVQTLAASGQTSARVEVMYQAGSAVAHGLREEEEEDDTDLSSILNSIQYKTGKKCTVMGLYDYDPEKQSPGDYPACELAFRAGDLMLVYGEERQDGFYHGERNGKRGLVPACFVEPVHHSAHTSKKLGASNGSTSPRS